MIRSRKRSTSYDTDKLFHQYPLSLALPFSPLVLLLFSFFFFPFLSFWFLIFLFFIVFQVLKVFPVFCFSLVHLFF